MLHNSTSGIAQIVSTFRVAALTSIQLFSNSFLSWKLQPQFFNFAPECEISKSVKKVGPVNLEI